MKTNIKLLSCFLDCDVCELDDSFNESNGYGCFEIQADKIACTCPDRQYRMNEPCRKLIRISLKKRQQLIHLGICNRENICGNDPESFCAEISTVSLGDQTDNPKFYACFCSDLSFNPGAPCPSSKIA